MLIRIYAVDAVKIADDYGLKKNMVERTARWDDPIIRYPLEAHLTLIKMRIGGSGDFKLHHYFLSFAKKKESKAMDLVAEHCDKARCYYIMPS